MFIFGKKPKTQRFEISWPVESNRDVHTYSSQLEASLPPLPARSETSSTRSGHSPTSSHSSYYSSFSPEEQYQHAPVIALPPKTYRIAESSRSLPLPPPPPPSRPTTSFSRESRHSPSSSQSSHPSYASSNTMYTARRGSTATDTISSCDDRSCQMTEPESDQMFEQFKEQINISDNLPDAQAVESAGEIPIFDSEGNSRPFKSIYSGELAIGEQQMVLFVRHFFCGACQAYIKALCKSITLQTYFTLPVPTSITIIGLGSPKLINSYRKATGTQFPIYADPTKKLYKALGMSWTIRTGPRVDYMKGINEYQWIKGQYKQVREENSDLRRKGGNIFWVGGEFMFKDEKPVWCHRMKNFRGHSEIETIKRLLGVEEAQFYHAM